MRALGMTAPQRSPLMPELPTLAEGGYPGMNMVDWYGLLVPFATPPDIIARLRDHVVKALADPVTRDKLLAAGAAPTSSTPAQFGEQLRDDLARWAKLTQSVKIRID